MDGVDVRLNQYDLLINVPRDTMLRFLFVTRSLLLFISFFSNSFFLLFRFLS